MKRIKRLCVVLVLSGICIWGTFFYVHGLTGKAGALFEWPEGVFSVFFLEVGDGDAIVIRTPDGSINMIDGGFGGVARVFFDSGRDVLDPFFRLLGINTIERIFLSHPDNDHLGGLLYILKNYPVNRMLDNGKTHSSRVYSTYLHTIYKNGIEYTVLRQDEVIELGRGVFLQVISSDPVPERKTNDASLVLKLTFGEFTLLLTGDIEKKIEEELILMYGEGLKSTVLKVPHHGADNASSVPFIAMANPEIAIISAGNNSRCNNPSERVLEKYKRNDVDIAVTKTDGTIALFSDGEKFLLKRHWGR